MSLAISVGEHDHFRGFATAPITLVEYGDYECLYCRAAYPAVNALLEYFESDLRFVFRHMPLTSFHHHRLEHGDRIIERLASCLVLMMDPVREIRGAPDALTGHAPGASRAPPTLKLETIRRPR
jgi:hypothetical protein